MQEKKARNEIRYVGDAAQVKQYREEVQEKNIQGGGRMKEEHEEGKRYGG